MALSSLATLGDLTARGIEINGVVTASVALAVASAAIRDAAGVAISEETSTVEFMGTRDRYITLPGGPVSAVSSVAINGVAVTDYVKVGSRLYRRSGWWSSVTRIDGSDVIVSDPSYPSVVTATYTHGYAEVPADIVDLTCQIAALVHNRANQGSYAVKDPNLTGYSMGEYRENFLAGPEAVASFVELPQRTRFWLRERFGSGGFA